MNTNDAKITGTWNDDPMHFLRPKGMARRSFLQVGTVVMLAASLGMIAHAEDPAALNYFDDLQGEAWGKAHANEAALHFEKWKTARGDEREREANIARFHAWRAQKPELIDQIIADGRLVETEVMLPDNTETVIVTVKYEVPDERRLYNDSKPVWRRITTSAFEVWTPHEGRLFNSRCETIAEAKPTRDHSEGREWHGAFLPDGRWITTELHESDGLVYIFDRNGRRSHEIKSGALLQSLPDKIRTASPLIIPWARSTKDGDAWIVRIGSEEGLGESLLEPNGHWRRLTKTESIWRLCQTRQLGVRLAGGICYFKTESDDGKLWMTSEQPGHGVGVGNPFYNIIGGPDVKNQSGEFGSIPSDGRLFGFWPRSHATYIFNDTRSWFFNAERHYQGWIAGERVGDEADNKSMIFRTKDGRCVTVSPTLRATHMRSFELPGGHRLLPLELHPDIGLGIFAKITPPSSLDEPRPTTTDRSSRTKELIVARWDLGGAKKKRQVGI